MNPFIIYLVGISDSIKELFFILASVIVVLGCFVPPLSDFDSDEMKKGWKKLLLPFTIFVVLSTLIPSTKLLATMIILPEIANSEVIKKDLPEIYNLAVEKLKTELK